MIAPLRGVKEGAQREEGTVAGAGNLGNKAGTFCTLRALLKICMLQLNMHEEVGNGP